MAANYRHIGGGENRLGRHYSRFSAFCPPQPLPVNHLLCENCRTQGRIGEIGLGSVAPVGVTFFGRVNLSPKLFRSQHQRLPAILTHELSHAHIQGWIGEPAYVLGLPNWFKEGLAVMVSGGGGAELVSEEEARAAIQRGEQIAIYDAGSLHNMAVIRFERAPAKTASWYPVVLAYRQAGMFVNYLRELDGPAFDRMMNAALDGRPFAEAVTVGYHDDLRSLWQKFIKSRSP